VVLPSEQHLLLQGQVVPQLNEGVTNDWSTVPKTLIFSSGFSWNKGWHMLYNITVLKNCANKQL